MATNDIDPIAAHIAAIRPNRATSTVEAREATLRRADRAQRRDAEAPDLPKGSRFFPLGVAYAVTAEIVSYLGTKGWEANTRATYYSHLRAFFAWGTKVGALSYDPMDGIERPKTSQGLPNPITDDELGLILAHPDDTYHLAALLAAGAGLRCCEIAQLCRQDVTAQAIRIRHGKGGRPGIVDTNVAIWTVVCPMRRGNLVEQLGGKPSPAWISNLGVRRAIELGLPGASLHRLRHWHGTSVLDHRGNLLAAQASLRHRSVSSTQGYALLRNSERAAAVAALPVIDSLPARKLAG